MPESIEHPRWEDMQGLILSAYPHLDRARYLLFTIENAAAAREWLARIQPHVTNAFKKQEPDGSLHRDRPNMNVNIALTAPGLAKMCGLTGNEPPDDLAQYLRGFSDAFIEGIHGREHRLRILGNIGDSAPERWDWGGKKPGTRPVHLLLMVFAYGDAATLQAAVDTVMPPLNAMTPVAMLPPTLPLGEAGGREHFGFADGLSQPILAGSHDAQRFPDSAHVTALGEFVFGYANQDGQPASPSDDPRERFRNNGSYLVFCQFEQDVNRFWNYVDQATAANGAANPHAAEQLASKIVGRLPDGTPLVPYVNRNDNEFDYTEDPYGYGCPIGAHIRRSNPRDTTDPPHRNRHRILRRGRSYGPRASHPRDTVGQERGLFFVCLNTDLERQFEFIQQNWTNNPGFSGLSDECDPLIGAESCPMGRGTFTVQGLPAPARLTTLPRFIKVRGAQYFFLPGIRALHALAKGECRANP